ncbi:MAG: NADH-quinone oxidoreductase subunit NuoH [Anaerolineales bacterium]|nr:NADH-quinone oxidoreductase subunit NuoH [Anaerolineales bacterium]
MQIDTALLIEWLIEAIIILAVCVVGFAYLTLFERRILARIQVRIGPNRAGPKGILQPVADGIKLIFKEELIPDRADKLVFILAPIITVLPALIILAVIPVGPTWEIFGYEITLGLAGDVNVGVLYIMAVASIAVYGIALAGWSSNNKYALMGGLRSAAQMVSYELVLGLAFIGPILLANSMSMQEIIDSQRNMWFIVLQPIGFLLFFIASVAEVNRAPFDMPEAEQELTAGYHAEYSGMKFALFFMAEYVKMIAVSVIAATLFLGGYLGPFVDEVPLLGPIYLFIKTLICLFIMVWLRATLPRIRYDRLMALGWKIALPVALLNVFVTAVLVVLLGGS